VKFVTGSAVNDSIRKNMLVVLILNCIIIINNKKSNKWSQHL